MDLVEGTKERLRSGLSFFVSPLSIITTIIANPDEVIRKYLHIITHDYVRAHGICLASLSTTLTQTN
jgi:hypothetical protein